MRSSTNPYLAILPAYNEAGAIASTVAEMRRWAAEFDVLVIDDGSTDATAVHATAAGAMVLRLPFNVGIGGAMQTGYIYARDHGYEVAVQVDGDGQHDPKELRIMLQVLLTDPSMHMVTGSRFLERRNGGHRSTMSRRIGNRILAALVSAMTGRRVTDATSGLRIVDRQAIELFAADYPHDYPETEAILLMHRHRLASSEVPVRMRPRTTGRSKITAGRPVYYMTKVTLALLVAFCRARPVPQSRTEAAPVATERVA